MGKKYVYISVFIAQFSALIASSTLTWSSPMLVKLNGTDDNPLGRPITSIETSLLASLAIFGACLGALSVGFLATRFGRKTILIASTLPCVIFYLIMAFATNIWLFYIGRIFTGMGLGLVFTVLTMYNGEIPDVENRGILGSSMLFFVDLGQLLPYCLGSDFPFFWFHIILAVIPAIYIPILYFFASESPHYLIERDPAAARKVLEKLRDAKEVDKQMETIEKASKNHPDAPFSDLILNKGVRKAFIIGLGGATFMQLTGTAVIASYTETIFQDAGQNISSKLCPIIIGGVQLFMTFFVTWITDRFPRKFLMVSSYLGVCLTLIPVGLYFTFKENGNDVSSFSLIPLIAICLCVIVFNLGVGPVSTTLLGEVFPIGIKGKAISVLVLYIWFTAFALNYLFNTLIEMIGLGMIFLVFSVSSFIGAIFAKFYIIETRGRTFEDIQKALAA